MKKKLPMLIKVGMLTILLMISTAYTISGKLVSAETDDYVISINPSEIFVGEITLVEITVENGSSVPQENVYVGLYGCGIDTNGTTNSSGKIQFAVNPVSTGDIYIDVGSEGNTITQTVTVTIYDPVYIVTIDPEYVSPGLVSIVDVLVANESSGPLDNVYVGLHGCGINTNGTTNSDGLVTFCIEPEATGEIHVDVGFEGNTMSQFITVTNWALKVNVSSPTAFEGETFIVTVVKEIEETPVEGAIVTFDVETSATDSQGKVTFTAPEVQIDCIYLIVATAQGYIPDTTTITILDKLNVDLTINANKFNMFFGKVSATVSNIENVTINNLNFSMEIKYGILGRKSAEGSIFKSKLISEESCTLEIKKLHGFGSININISVYADGVDKVTQEINGFIFGRLIFLKSS